MIKVSEKIFNELLNSNGKFAEKVSGIPAEKIIREMFDERRAIEQMDLLKRYLPYSDIRGKRLLEIGSGIGVFNIVAKEKYSVDAWGIEPVRADGGSFEVARDIFNENGLTAEKILGGKGESLPFEDGSFDIVYSENVLEHTDNPAKTIAEAIRVCRSGGIIQMVFPNYGSFFDGHYACFYFPYQPKWFNKFWVKYILKRDPIAVDLSRTEINYFSVKKWLQPYLDRKDIDVITFGEEIFRDRMKKINFSSWAGLGKVKKWIELAHKMKIISFLTFLMISIKAHTPIVLTIKKNMYV